MVSIKRILSCISEDECVILANRIGEAVIDSDDRVENIDGIETVFIKHGPNADDVLPVPSSDFNKITIMDKGDFVFRNIMEMFCGGDE